MKGMSGEVEGVVSGIRVVERKAVCWELRGQ